MSYNIAEHGWRFNGLRDGETIADLCKAVFVRSNNEAFKRTNAHTHTQAHTHTDTHQWMQWARRQCLAFRLKSGYKLTPLDISWRKVVQLHSCNPLKSWRLVSSVRSISAVSVPIAYRPEGSDALFTWNVSIRLFDLALKWRLMTVTIWMTIGRRTYLVNLRMCAQIGTSGFSRLFAVHNRATHRANCGVDLWSRPRSNLNPAIESPHATFYLLAMTMFVISVIVGEILTVELYMTLTLNFRIG